MRLKVAVGQKAPIKELTKCAYLNASKHAKRNHHVPDRWRRTRRYFSWLTNTILLRYNLVATHRRERLSGCSVLRSTNFLAAGPTPVNLCRPRGTSNTLSSCWLQSCAAKQRNGLVLGSDRSMLNLKMFHQLCRSAGVDDHQVSEAK